MQMVLERDPLLPALPSSRTMRNLSEWQIIRAYVRLLHAQGDENGCRQFTLARHGAYEVRLCELTHDPSLVACPLWLELFDHREGRRRHARDCYDFEQAVTAGDDLIRLARELDARSASN